MPLFNASILTGSKQNTYANIQFGPDRDDSGSGVLSAVVHPFDGSSSPARPVGSTSTGDTLVLNDPAGITDGILVNDVQAGSPPYMAISGVAIKLKTTGNYRITLTQQYSSYSANVDGVGLKLVDFQILKGGGYTVQPVFMDLMSTYSDSGGTQEITPVGTSTTFTVSSNIYLTVVLCKEYLANGGAFTTGTVRFKLEKL